MEINRDNTYLSGEDSVTDRYRATLNTFLKTLETYSTPTQLRRLRKELQMTGIGFDEAKFLQAACETSVSGSIAIAFPDSFEYEPKISPPSDVDCAFKHNGFKFNIEVKCPDYSKVHAQKERDVFNIGAFGRMPDYQDLTIELMEMFGNTGKPLEVQPHMDNKLKDYLLSANKKFPQKSNENELNILLVCCDTPIDMQKWFYYMFGSKGLLTPESFHPPKDYSKVDVVVLTNLYHRHYSYKTKTKITNHWSLAHSFNLVFENRSVQINKNRAIRVLTDILPNFSREISKLQLSAIDAALRIPIFIHNELTSKEIFYFD